MSPIELTKAQQAKLAPLEHAEQSLLFQWAEHAKGKHPELDDLYAIPNWIGAGTARHGAYLKAEGRKAGVPDMHLPHARGPFHSLYIELKRLYGASPTPSQRDWHNRLAKAGHCVWVCYGWKEARDTLLYYLTDTQILVPTFPHSPNSPL